MGKKFAELLRIKNDRKITRETDFTFLYHLQNSLLLALKEQGRLNAMQYRYAEESLRRQQREYARKMQQDNKTK